MIKIAVSIPAYGGKIDVGQAGMWASFGHALAANEDTHELVSWGYTDCNPVADARNVAVEAGLRAGADWLLMIDADTYHEGPEDDVPTGGYQLLDMITTGARLNEESKPLIWQSGVPTDQTGGNVALIGAGVLSRGWTPPRRTVWIEKTVARRLDALYCSACGAAWAGDACIARCGRGGEAQPRVEMLSVPEVAEEKDYAGRVVEVARIGGACVAVNLGWIRRAWPDPPWYYHARYDEGERQRRLHAVGEDVAFCDGARQRGGRIYVDGRYFPKHVMRAERK